MLLTDFATRTELVYRENRSSYGVWTIGIDYGFSGVKGFSPNKYFCYPNCAVKKDDAGNMLEYTNNDIFIRDDEGTWLVGSRAHDTLSSSDAMNYEAEMYGRNRYFTPSFRAVMKAGIGIGLASARFRKYKGEPIYIQTGLPPKYKEQDTPLITEALAGHYDFEMKIGKEPFRRYTIDILPENIFIMEQPMGSLFSAITDNNCIQTSKDTAVLKSNTLVFDPGFKTLDLYNISSGMLSGSETFDNLGMHEVFRRTVEEAKKKYGSNLTIPGMQSALKKGYITSFDRKLMESRHVSFDDILYKNVQAVCDEAIQKIVSLYDYMRNHDYLIVTGGTGNAWFPYIAEKFKNMESLQIISANHHDPAVSNTYSNVRGYYLYIVQAADRQRR